MKTLKIALFDFRHSTIGLHAYQMPLSIGLLGGYVKQELARDGVEIDVRLYVSAEKFLEEFRNWKPDIAGGSFYTWNRALTLFVLGKIKESIPNTITVLGGPEIEKDYDDQREFLVTYPQVDFGVLGEGEKPLVDIARHSLASGKIKPSEPIRGTFYLEKDGQTLCVSEAAVLFVTLDEIPSPYTSGMFDEFFDINLHPMIQAARGCPFTCTFCNMSLKQYNKVRKFSLERVAADLEYCAKKLRRHEITLTIADSNFGMYPWDIEVAKEIRRIQEKWDWPRYISLSSGKNNKERVLETSTALKWSFPITLSAQSTHKPTLSEIKRSNISLDVMFDSIRYAQEHGLYNYGELIANLPLETRESFEHGIKTFMSVDIGQIILMQLVLLRGTPLAEKETIKQHGFYVKSRIIPRAFGEYEGERVVEIESMVAGSNTFPHGDYMYFRKLQLIIAVVYNAEMFHLVRRLLVELGADQWEWVKRVFEMIEMKHGKAKEQMDLFEREAHAELFESKEAVLDFVNEDENYGKLLQQERGDNLINKYMTIALSEYGVWLDVAAQSALDILGEMKSQHDYSRSQLREVCKFSKLIYDIFPYFEHSPEAGEGKTHFFKYDIKRWMEDRSLKLQECQSETAFRISFSSNQVEKMKGIIDSGHDSTQIKQHVYRDKRYHTFIPQVEWDDPVLA